MDLSVDASFAQKTVVSLFVPTCGLDGSDDGDVYTAGPTDDGVSLFWGCLAIDATTLGLPEETHFQFLLFSRNGRHNQRKKMKICFNGIFVKCTQFGHGH